MANRSPDAFQGRENLEGVFKLLRDLRLLDGVQVDVLLKVFAILVGLGFCRFSCEVAKIDPSMLQFNDKLKQN